MNFDQAFHRLLGHEGSYSNHASDPGGETMWGVTIKVARAHGYNGPMAELPVNTAKAIYRDLYWDAVRADEMPAAIRYPLFDAAVNSGVRQAVKWLQSAVDASADGAIGPQTMRLVNEANPDKVVRKMVGERLRFMAGLSTWPAFSRGWTRRLADILETA